VLGMVGDSGMQGGGEQGDSPCHPRQEGIEKMKSQKLKCCD